MEKYDLIVIGGGAAGFAAAIKADSTGARTLLVNGGIPVGGTCVNVGCVPTKFLLEVAKDYFRAKNYPFQSLQLKAKIDFGKLMQEKDELVNYLRESNYLQVLKNLPQVTYKEGMARFISAKEIEVQGEKFTAPYFILATGSSSRVIPVEGLKEAGFLTHRTILELKKLPQSLLIIGGGPIGLEFAQIFSRLGSKVTLVEAMERILSPVEPIISHALTEYLREEGINILSGVKLKRVERKNNKKLVTIEKEKSSQEIEVEEILLAAGVRGNSAHLGIENIGVEVGKGGFVRVNEFLQTSIPHIYAAGDVIGPPLLETVAAKEGNIAVRNALSGEGEKIDYRNIPSAVFTSPQVAWVGIKEAEYTAKYGTCLCRKVDMKKVPRAMLGKETKGFIFMVIGHKDEKIKGVHILSELSSEIIHEATLAIRQGLTIGEITDMVHVFPTFSEAVKIAAQVFKHAPEKMSCCIE
ncbi:MAG: mercury(II) reductase [Caldiserica bacterium]|nr:mercury(II) reductase [Caldisericota bacterium]